MNPQWGPSRSAGKKSLTQNRPGGRSSNYEKGDAIMRKKRKEKKRERQEKKNGIL